MRKIFHIGFAAMALLAVSCQKEMQLEEKLGKTYTATIEEDEQTRSPVDISGDIAKFSWDNGDPITVISKNGSLIEKTSIKVQSGKATFAVSSISAPGYATYPQIAKTYTGGLLTEVTLPSVYDNYTGSTNVPMFADMSGSGDVANFRHIGGAIRITLKNIPENCTKFKFIMNGKKITGDFSFDVDADIPAIKTSNSTSGNTVTFNFAAGTEEMDFFIPLPVGEYNGFTIKLFDGNTLRYKKESTKTFMIERKELQGYKALELPVVLTFDFSTFPPGWPTAVNSALKDPDGVPYNYTLDGVNYEFILADPIGTTTGHHFKCSTATDGLGYLRVNAWQRSIGLPVIKDKKLVKVECYNAAGANGNNLRTAGITSQLYKVLTETTIPTTVKYVTGGEPVQMKDRYGIYTFNLSGTENDKRYYIYNELCWIGIRGLTLTYEGTEKLIDEIPATPDEDEAEKESITVRVGSFNIRSSAMDKNTGDAWSSRKTKVRTSIQNNKYDFFGVQEVMSDQQTYLKNNLTTYTFKFFSPYAQNGSGDRAQGLAYNKNLYTLSDWHYFWVSNTPDKMTTNDSSTSNGETTTYSRGGCCGILTHKSTGIKIFVMVTHGLLDDVRREQFAYVYEDMEKKYNPNGYPSFFVGDMNTTPDTGTAATTKLHWYDAYITLSAIGKATGPYGTFNGFDEARDMNAAKRIDYIYYRGECTPLKYVCDNAKISSLYPSDHLPVYADFKIMKK